MFHTPSQQMSDDSLLYARFMDAVRGDPLYTRFMNAVSEYYTLFTALGLMSPETQEYSFYREVKENFNKVYQELVEYRRELQKEVESARRFIYTSANKDAKEAQYLADKAAYEEYANSLPKNRTEQVARVAAQAEVNKIYTDYTPAISQNAKELKLHKANKNLQDCIEKLASLPEQQKYAELYRSYAKSHYDFVFFRQNGKKNATALRELRGICAKYEKWISEQTSLIEQKVNERKTPVIR